MHDEYGCLKDLEVDLTDSAVGTVGLNINSGGSARA